MHHKSTLINSIIIPIHSENNRFINFNPITAYLYEGEIVVSVKVDAQNSLAPTILCDVSANGVNSKEWLREHIKDIHFSSSEVSGDFQIKTKGHQPTQWKHYLQARGKFILTELTWQNINLHNLWQQGRDLLRGSQSIISPKELPSNPRIERVQSIFSLRDGVLHLSNLRASNDLLIASGEGYIDFMHNRTEVAVAIQEQQAQLFKTKLAKSILRAAGSFTVPSYIKGTFIAPSQGINKELLVHQAFINYYPLLVKKLSKRTSNDDYLEETSAMENEYNDHQEPREEIDSLRVF